MFHKYIKIALAILITAWAVYEFTQGHIGMGIMYILLAGVVVFFYFKNEMLLLAFLRVRKQDFAGANKWLDKIKNPSSALIRKQEGYFNLMKGIMTSQTNLNESEKYLKNALKLGLSMNHDIAMAKLQLAGIAMTKRRKREATELLNEAKKLDKYNMLTDQIKMFKEQLKKI
jgi:hypothetical protein